MSILFRVPLSPRYMVPTLAEGLAEVARRCGSPTFDKDMLYRISNGGIETVLMSEEGKGTIGWILIERTVPQTVFIHAAWVHPDHRSVSTARRGVKAVREFLASLGISYMSFISPRPWTNLGFAPSATLWAAEV